MSAPRSQACSAILNDGSLLVAGGLGASGPVNTAEIYAPGGAFTATASMTQARSGAACATLLDGRVLVTGGNDGQRVLDTAEIFDPIAQTWQTTGRLSVAREGHLAVLTAWGAVWVAGGVNADGIVGALEQYDVAPGSFRLMGTLITPRTGFAMASLPRHRIMIAGGTNGTSTLSSVEIYDGIIGALSAGGSMAEARSDFAAAALPDGTVLIAGGLDANGALLSSTEIFDPARAISTAGPNLLTPRARHFAYALPENGAVLIGGGIGDSGALQSTETYAPWTGGLQASAPMNASRRANVAAILHPGSLLVAGGRNETGPLSGSELFQYATIATAKSAYTPGMPITIAGAGWEPGEQVVVRIAPLPLNRRQVDFQGTAVADDAGNVTVEGFQADRSRLGTTLIVSASGRRSQAQTSFTVQIDPTIGFVFSPASAAVPGSPVTVQVTFTGASGVPGGNIVPCINNTCPTPGSSPVGATCDPAGPQPQEYSLVAGASASTCTFTITAIPPGQSLIGVEYNGDSNYNLETANQNNVTYTARSASIAMLAPLSAVVPYGSSAAYVAQVTTTPGLGLTVGVQFLVNGSPYGPPVSLTPAGGNNYNASFIPSPPLPAGGPYTINASFPGDLSNPPILSNTISITVTNGVTATTEGFSANSIVYGQALTVSGVVTAPGGGTPSGTVTVSGVPGCVNVALTGLGTYSCTATPSNPGTLAVTAAYIPAAGSGFLASASGVANVNVTAVSTQVSPPIVVSASGGNFTFSATVTTPPPGQAPVTSGTLSFYGVLSAGPPANACTTTGTPLAANLPVNSFGTATTPTIALAAGTYTICAAYTPGNGGFGPSVSPGINITSPGPAILATLQAPTQPLGAITFGASTTITATVTSTAAGNSAPVPGTLTFFDASYGNVQIGSPAAVVQIGGSNAASASIVASNLTAGPHQIYTSYTSGNGAFTPPTPNKSPNGAIQVNPASANFTVGSGAPSAVSAGANVAAGASVTLIATYTGGLSTPPTGTVNLINASSGNAVVCTATLSSGVAACNATAVPGSNLPSGAESINIAYAGDANYTLGAVTPFAFTVGKASTTTLLTPTPSPAIAGQIVTLTATVSSTVSNPKPTGTYTFGLSGAVSNSTCGAPVTVNAPTGTATCTFEILSAGNPSYTATYSGDTSFSTSAGSVSLISQKATPGAISVTVSPASLVSGQSFSIAVDTYPRADRPRFYLYPPER